MPSASPRDVCEEVIIKMKIGNREMEIRKEMRK
jgi:hypothetical protein